MDRPLNAAASQSVVQAPANLGLFGGSFDPPHAAHRALADAALTQLGLDEIVWVPAGHPWQKSGRRLASGADRTAMLRLLIDGEPRYRIDERELRRTGPSYTVDTLRELQAERPGARWWLIVGQDQYGHLDTWHDWPELVARAGIAVAGRDGQAVHAAPGLAGVAHAVHALALPPLAHAATGIRARLAAGEDVTALVGAPVARYIARHHLYQGDPAGA